MKYKIYDRVSLGIALLGFLYRVSVYIHDGRFGQPNAFSKILLEISSFGIVGVVAGVVVATWYQDRNVGGSDHTQSQRHGMMGAVISVTYGVMVYIFMSVFTELNILTVSHAAFTAWLFIFSVGRMQVHLSTETEH